ncbi:MAG: excinuclease ABC subunit UvrA [Gammaproteobacteria bacterium]|nr:excinuclease ABC subunit UvrA [Gammaproteobacteria bacterium]
MPKERITIKGASQNNLKNIDLQLPLGELIVITGVSGSGKSSLAFDTLYSEGQRRYVETFSPYARQFLERMDKPQAKYIDGIPPAIAIDQTNPVRTSRSTVGTMTELNDHIKLLFARSAKLSCRGCGQPVQRDAAPSILKQLIEKGKRHPGLVILITFTVAAPENFTTQEIRAELLKQGYSRFHHEGKTSLEVIQDRVRISADNSARISEALEAALKHGRGHINVYPLETRKVTQARWLFSTDLHCPDCNIHYRDPVPNLFSFNSPIGACKTCRGFGRTQGIDYERVIPDPAKTLTEGAVKPWQSKSYLECQSDLMRFAHRRGIPTERPWNQLEPSQRRWVLEGEGDSKEGKWYGIQRFFDWLETKSYKMHIRVLLSKYRAYRRCPDCLGARLKPDALLWRLGDHADADRVLPVEKRFRPALSTLDEARHATLAGLTLHDVMCLPIERGLKFFEQLQLPAPLDKITKLLVGEIRTRLQYLRDVGLGYLTLDRQSRTLSGGEVQRINLTTALGTSLVNTLFVLDEPSIGLHPRDIQRLITVLHRLRNAGNSLVVVEHDPQLILAADRILDLGPGPGERGGEIVFYGTAKALLRSRRSLTADYLNGRKTALPDPKTPNRPPPPSTAQLVILGAAENNLKNIDVRIPLQRLVCVTGVSGSGKSTLVQGICYNALSKLKAKPKDPPGRHRALHGHQHIQEVVLVNQSPIGKTTRSTPASYMGALDGIRKAFAAEPLAHERNYTAGTFSFNSGNGRCPSCGGNGFEHVEMQFLSDVYLRCADCDGRRYRAEVLEVKLLPAGENTQGTVTQSEQRPRSIADVLDMTVSEALKFFAAYPDVLRRLQPLEAVGLSYMTLGQPVPTLSGGEAQRLKLAGHLAKAHGRQGKTDGTLFLFDEPTTGLHFDDIAKLLRAFRELVEKGHSLVVIEHNLDVIRSADWIIDLGPEGGEAGGEIICAGPLQELLQCRNSHTGAALSDFLGTLNAVGTKALFSSYDTLAERPGKTTTPKNDIRIHNAREHNLKGIDIRIPRDRFTVITGVSGSGKSTVAFDILFAEGQRRYLESLNAYARQLVQPATRPDVDAIYGIPPTVAIEQRSSRGGHKSTVATMTEIYPFLRLLFVKLGIQYCPDCCNIPIQPQTPEAIQARILRDFRNRDIGLYAPLVVARKGYYTDLAKWAAKKGFSQLRVDGVLVSTQSWPRLDRFKEHDIELPIGELRVTLKAETELRRLIDRALDLGKGMVKLLMVSREKVSVQSPSSNSLSLRERVRVRVHNDGGNEGLRDKRSRIQEIIFSTRRACPGCGRSFGELDPRLFSFNSRLGWCEHCYGTGLKIPDFDEQQSGEERQWTRNSATSDDPCPACQGQRLCPEALAVRFRDKSITAYTQSSVEVTMEFFHGLKLRGRETKIARDIQQELCSRLSFLKGVGLSYLTLDRSAPTLSGGEAQRIRLAAQLGSNLRGVCYILDEPTIGLHPRDNRMLLNTLKGLERKGNTVVVVEHDEETIRQAEYVVDLGPGAGTNGGRVVAQGSLRALMHNRESQTGRYLSRPLRHPLVENNDRPLTAGTEIPQLEIVAADLHNLKSLSLTIPLGKLVCVTGVSGSGKSTLVREVIHENLKRLLSKKRARGRRRTTALLRGCREIKGWEAIHRILEVDQTPIGKTPRSCPATYIGLWVNIRQLFAQTPEAHIRGFGPGRFSFNIAGGRCETCKGKGTKRIEMSFLPDVQVACEACDGSRFNEETFHARFKDKHIAEVLAMSVDEAVSFFAAQPRIHHPLQLLQDVGLGYLSLGQQSPTLSGGEAQRIKLVAELVKTKPRNTPVAQAMRKGLARKNTAMTLYVLDEPTIGLHMADVEKLIRVLHRLVSAGNTVIIIEHNLDIIAEADWIIDLGPEGGESGGGIVAQGTIQDLIRSKKRSHTARFLFEFLSARGSKG